MSTQALPSTIEDILRQCPKSVLTSPRVLIATHRFHRFRVLLVGKVSRLPVHPWCPTENDGTVCAVWSREIIPHPRSIQRRLQRESLSFLYLIYNDAALDNRRFLTESGVYVISTKKSLPSKTRGSLFMTLKVLSMARSSIWTPSKSFSESEVRMQN